MFAQYIRVILLIYFNYSTAWNVPDVFWATHISTFSI